MSSFYYSHTSYIYNFFFSSSLVRTGKNIPRQGRTLYLEARSPGWHVDINQTKSECVVLGVFCHIAVHQTLQGATQIADKGKSRISTVPISLSSNKSWWAFKNKKRFRDYLIHNYSNINRIIFNYSWTRRRRGISDIKWNLNFEITIFTRSIQ